MEEESCKNGELENGERESPLRVYGHNNNDGYGNDSGNNSD